MGSLTQGATTVTLSDDFDFPDEFNWSAIQQSKNYSVTGALMVEVALKQTGRMITLQAGDGYAWMTRAQLDDLYSMRETPDVNMTLIFRGVTYTVRFDIEAGAIDARPVVDFSDPGAADMWIATLRFYTV